MVGMGDDDSGGVMIYNVILVVMWVSSFASIEIEWFFVELLHARY